MPSIFSWAVSSFLFVSGCTFASLLGLHTWGWDCWLQAMYLGSCWGSPAPPTRSVTAEGSVGLSQHRVVLSSEAYARDQPRQMARAEAGGIDAQASVAFSLLPSWEGTQRTCSPHQVWSILQRDQSIMACTHHCSVVQRTVPAPNTLCALPGRPSITPTPGNLSSLTVTMLFTFPECHIVGITYCVACSDWLLSLDMRLTSSASSHSLRTHSL